MPATARPHTLRELEHRTLDRKGQETYHSIVLHGKPGPAIHIDEVLEKQIPQRVKDGVLQILRTQEKSNVKIFALRKLILESQTIRNLFKIDEIEDKEELDKIFRYVLGLITKTGRVVAPIKEPDAKMKTIIQLEELLRKEYYRDIAKVLEQENLPEDIRLAGHSRLHNIILKKLREGKITEVFRYVLAKDCPKLLAREVKAIMVDPAHLKDLTHKYGWRLVRMRIEQIDKILGTKTEFIHAEREKTQAEKHLEELMQRRAEAEKRLAESPRVPEYKAPEPKPVEVKKETALDTHKRQEYVYPERKNGKAPAHEYTLEIPMRRAPEKDAPANPWAEPKPRKVEVQIDTKGRVIPVRKETVLGNPRPEFAEVKAPQGFPQSFKAMGYNFNYAGVVTGNYYNGYLRYFGEGFEALVHPRKRAVMLLRSATRTYSPKYADVGRAFQQAVAKLPPLSQQAPRERVQVRQKEQRRVLPPPIPKDARVQRIPPVIVEKEVEETKEGKSWKDRAKEKATEAREKISRILQERRERKERERLETPPKIKGTKKAKEEIPSVIEEELPPVIEEREEESKRTLTAEEIRETERFEGDKKILFERLPELTPPYGMEEPEAKEFAKNAQVVSILRNGIECEIDSANRISFLIPGEQKDKTITFSGRNDNIFTITNGVICEYPVGVLTKFARFVKKWGEGKWKEYAEVEEGIPEKIIGVAVYFKKTRKVTLYSVPEEAPEPAKPATPAPESVKPEEPRVVRVESTKADLNLGKPKEKEERALREIEEITRRIKEQRRKIIATKIKIFNATEKIGFEVKHPEDVDALAIHLSDIEIQTGGEINIDKMLNRGVAQKIAPMLSTFGAFLKPMEGTKYRIRDVRFTICPVVKPTDSNRIYCVVYVTKNKETKQVVFYKSASSTDWRALPLRGGLGQGDLYHNKLESELSLTLPAEMQSKLDAIKPIKAGKAETFITLAPLLREIIPESQEDIVRVEQRIKGTVYEGKKSQVLDTSDINNCPNFTDPKFILKVWSLDSSIYGPSCTRVCVLSENKNFIWVFTVTPQGSFFSSAQVYNGEISQYGLASTPEIKDDFGPLLTTPVREYQGLLKQRLARALKKAESLGKTNVVKEIKNILEQYEHLEGTDLIGEYVNVFKVLRQHPLFASWQEPLRRIAESRTITPKPSEPTKPAKPASMKVTGISPYNVDLVKDLPTGSEKTRATEEKREGPKPEPAETKPIPPKEREFYFPEPHTFKFSLATEVGGDKYWIYADPEHPEFRIITSPEIGGESRICTNENWFSIYVFY